MVNGWGSESPFGLVSKFSASRRKKHVVSRTRVSVRCTVFLLRCSFFPIKSLLMLLELKGSQEICHDGLSQKCPQTQTLVYVSIIRKGIRVERTLLCRRPGYPSYSLYHDKLHIAMPLTEVMQKAIMYTEYLYDPSVRAQKLYRARSAG